MRGHGGRAVKPARRSFSRYWLWPLSLSRGSGLASRYILSLLVALDYRRIVWRHMRVEGSDLSGFRAVPGAVYFR
jgi:hypothetical protein